MPGTIPSFRRDCYDEVKNALDESQMVFMLGPRKCGKTVCLLQLSESLEHARYADFKENDVMEQVLESIEKDDGTVWLLDEITYAPDPERNICQIAGAFPGVQRTKVVFAGSQSVALEHWANIATAGCGSTKIHVDFLGYGE